MNEADLNQLLISLDLTKLQAKVYIALARLDMATGRATAKAANVAPADIYRVLFELSEKGLVQKVLAKPSLYKAVSLQDGIAILLNRRETQTDLIKAVIPEIIENEKTSNKKEEEPFIYFEAGKGAFFAITDNIFKSATISLDLITNFREAMQGQEIIGCLLLDLLTHRVRIREILSRNQMSKPSINFMKCQKTGFYEVRYIDYPEPVHLIIKDRKEVFVSTKINATINKLPHLYFSNPVLITIIQQWFDNLWDKCSKVQETM